MVGPQAPLSRRMDQAFAEGAPIADPATTEAAGDARDTQARLGPQRNGAADRPTKAAPGCCDA